MSHLFTRLRCEEQGGTRPDHGAEERTRGKNRDVLPVCLDFTLGGGDGRAIGAARGKGSLPFDGAASHLGAKARAGRTVRAGFFASVGHRPWSPGVW